jgi:UDP-GlcNAc3NAcA epimerase
MPEETNRITCDNASSFLFSPTRTGVKNLAMEGIINSDIKPVSVGNPRVYHCGDVMYDNSLYFSEIASRDSKILARFGLTENEFILATIHRNTNTNDAARLNYLFNALLDIHKKSGQTIILPLHPRTKKCVDEFLDESIMERIAAERNFILCEPVSFLDMIMLEKNCSLVMTDSGGVQKEAFYFEKPCLILRSETEWVELVEEGTAIIAGADRRGISKAYDKLVSSKKMYFPKIFGDGHAAEFICNELVKHLS